MLKGDGTKKRSLTISSLEPDLLAAIDLRANQLGFSRDRMLKLHLIQEFSPEMEAITQAKEHLYPGETRDRAHKVALGKGGF